MADALDSKSSGRKVVWVQVPPPVLLLPIIVGNPVLTHSSPLGQPFSTWLRTIAR